MNKIHEFIENYKKTNPEKEIKKIGIDVDGTLYCQKNGDEIPNLELLSFIETSNHLYDITIHSGGGKEYAETMFKQLMTRYYKKDKGLEDYEAWNNTMFLFGSGKIIFKSKGTHVLDGQTSEKWEFDMFFDDDAKFYGDLMVLCVDNSMIFYDGCKDFYSKKENYEKLPDNKIGIMVSRDI